MQLRTYQKSAVQAAYAYFREHKSGNACIVIPTGGGKTPILADICNNVAYNHGHKVLVVTHVRELIEQAYDKLIKYNPDLEAITGINSAGLGRRDTDTPILLAGIQSVYKDPAALGERSLMIIDEAHLIPSDGDGMYRTFVYGLRQFNPEMRVLGLTATPFRMDCGEICGPGNILNEVVYEISVRDLIQSNFLCPTVSKGSLEAVDASLIKLRGGEFAANDAETVMMGGQRVQYACAEICIYAKGRKHVLIFACGIKHAEAVKAAIELQSGEECGIVTGDTPAAVRDDLLRRFRGESISAPDLFNNAPLSPLKYMVNVNVLTTGFDHPGIDLIALLRPTMSPGLYYQMVGRGFRMCEGKSNCLVLDYGGNVMRHGLIDNLSIDVKAKKQGKRCRECPACHTFVNYGIKTCPICGEVFKTVERKPRHFMTASDADPLSGGAELEDLPVEGVMYQDHKKKDADDSHPHTLRVVYSAGGKQYSEWICLEHVGFARRKAEKWWQMRFDTSPPDTIAEALEVIGTIAHRQTYEITLKRTPGNKYPEIVAYLLGAEKTLPALDDPSEGAF